MAMLQTRTVSRQRSDLEIERAAIVWALALLAVALTACGGGDNRDTAEVTEQEETLATTETLPDTVLAKAMEINALLGPEVHCDRWFWDDEDSAWECTVVGLSRTAELDITPEARFSELELAVTFVEIQRFAPDIAEMIQSICGSSEQTVAELSMRHVDLISAEPDLEELWTEPDLFLEVQCPGGEDFEIDPFGSLITASDDDVDPERAGPTGSPDEDAP
jgi:hypothetical protein